MNAGAVPLGLLLADLRGEHAALDDTVADIDDRAWDTPTPSVGWSVRDQIGHLTYYDRAAVLAVTDPESFAAEDASQAAAAAARVRGLAPSSVLQEWRSGREALLLAVEPLDAKTRIDWYGPPMSAQSFVTARLMETWAHGLDVADALRRAYPETERLRHVCHLGVSTRGWSFVCRGGQPPEGDVRVELVPPVGGPPWTWGDSADDRVSGPAVDFCLVVTQRRLLADTRLQIDGPLAAAWMANAQAFAGPATATDPARHRLVG